MFKGEFSDLVRKLSVWLTHQQASPSKYLSSLQQPTKQSVRRKGLVCWWQRGNAPTFWLLCFKTYSSPSPRQNFFMWCSPKALRKGLGACLHSVSTAGKVLLSFEHMQSERFRKPPTMLLLCIMRVARESVFCTWNRGRWRCRPTQPHVRGLCGGSHGRWQHLGRGQIRWWSYTNPSTDAADGNASERICLRFPGQSNGMQAWLCL